MFKNERLIKEMRVTGINSFEGFKELAKCVLQKNQNSRFIMVKFDVRNFKIINRIYSFETGDQVIYNIKRALEKVLEQDKSAFARIGVDSFVLLMPYADKEKLLQMRTNFITEFRIFMSGACTINITFPTGQYILSKEDMEKQDISNCYEKANFAHCYAKNNEGSEVVDYQETMEDEAIFRQEIENKMRPALQNDEFALYLQPKYKLSNEKLCGAEALVRWADKDKLYVYPTKFVPVFERNGFIVEIDMYMFKKAVEFIRQLLEKEIDPPVISVNFSRYHLENSEFVERLCEIADCYQVPHEYLEIELTETIICNNVELIIRILRELHEHGFKMSMDDFGDGYSSLGLLKDLEVDTIKFDRKFLGDTFQSQRAKTVVASLIQMAKSLNIVTVAEGVETRAVVDSLKEIGCDIVQGFYFARPMPQEEMLKLLENNR